MEEIGNVRTETRIVWAGRVTDSTVAGRTDGTKRTMGNSDIDGLADGTATNILATQQKSSRHPMAWAEAEVVQKCFASLRFVCTTLVEECSSMLTVCAKM